MKEGYSGGKKTPCYGCENRKVGCHAECEAYAEAKKQLKEAKDDVKRQYDIPINKKPRRSKNLMRRY